MINFNNLFIKFNLVINGFKIFYMYFFLFNIGKIYINNKFTSITKSAGLTLICKS